jgi:uncharacterized protein (TIGR00255 family)
MFRDKEEDGSVMQSMTAFARVSGQGDWAYATWELRSINHRFLEVTVRMPEELRALEAAVRERIGEHLRRGKIDCVLRCDPFVGSTAAPRVQLDLARQLVEACRSIEGLLDRPAPVSPLDLLRWPGVIAFTPLDIEWARVPLLQLLDTAIANLVENRRREGTRLRTFVEERCAAAQEQVAQLAKRLPAIIADWKDRLLARARELADGLDPGRLEQEMLMIAQRLDVAEELERLDIHIAEIRRLLTVGDAVGRRLDFLLQEMNRESNTIASKSSHTATTGAAVELKVLIEQMREQAQNIE